MKKFLLTMLQSKGGCGKSEVSALIIDLLIQKYGNSKIKTFDNDSETPKLSSYPAAKAEHIQLYKLDENGHVKAESLNINKMDPISIELEHGATNVVYVDNGSPSFQPYISYFGNPEINIFNEIGVQCIIVTIVTADKITHRAPLELLNTYGTSVKYIIIENEHFGEVTLDEFPFEDKQADYAILKMERLTSAQNETLTRARDMSLLLSEAIKSKDFSLIQKSRLNTVKKSFDTPFLEILEGFENE